MTKKTDRRGTPRGAGVIEGAGKGNGGRIGNPPFVPTDQQRQEIMTLAKVTNQEGAAIVMGISVDTIDRHFREEWNRGAAQAVVMVGGKLLDKALKGHGPSINFYLATRGKGAYSRRIEVTGANGGPVKHYDLSNFSPEVKRAMLAEVDAAIADAEIEEAGNERQRD